MKKKANISDRALELINQQKIRPIPKWEFVVKNWGLWLGFGISLGLLILGTGVSWFGIANNIITPYLWLFAVAIFLILSFNLFQKTKRAYRFEKWQIMVLIVIIGVTIGGTIFKIGWAGRVDRGLESRFGFYRQMVPMKMTAWNNPEQGYLSGKIIIISNTGDFQIRDFNNKLWKIESKNPVIKGRIQMVVGEEIKLIGKRTGTDTFVVEEIRPWGGMGQNMMKEN